MFSVWASWISSSRFPGDRSSSSRRTGGWSGSLPPPTPVRRPAAGDGGTDGGRPGTRNGPLPDALASSLGVEAEEEEEEEKEDNEGEEDGDAEEEEDGDEGALLLFPLCDPLLPKSPVAEPMIAVSSNLVSRSDPVHVEAPLPLLLFPLFPLNGGACAPRRCGLNSRSRF